MGNKQTLLSDQDLADYQTLTFLTRQEILQVLKRFCQLVNINYDRSQETPVDLSQQRLSKRKAANINELHENPFSERIVEVFSSQADGSITFEDFLDMMSVFSENAPKSVKVSYAFKIYQGIYTGHRPHGASVTPDAIDLYDVKEIVRRLSGTQFDGAELTKIAEAVINEVDLRDDKKITAEIFEYFLSNVPDFPSSFIIPIKIVKENSKGSSSVPDQPYTTTASAKRATKRRIHHDG